MQSLKMWLINIGLKKMGPSLIRAALAWVLALVAANPGMLETFGIVYDKVAHTITLHVNTLEAWLLGAGLGTITALLAAAQHHTTATIAGKPQDGTHIRAEDPKPTEGGKK